MTFELFLNSSEKNALTKAIQSKGSYNGNILGETSIISPSFLIEAESLVGCNYLFCKEFGRYYFISDIAIVRTNLWRVACEVDVLMSFKIDILQLSCIIDKQESVSKANVFMDDGSFITESRAPIEAIEFPKGVSDIPNFVLVTLGSGKDKLEG